jgi:hypothetical protein
MRWSVAMRIIICEDAHKLLDDFLYSALSSWSSGRIADILGYSSEEALLFRAWKLEDATLEAEAIYKPQWKQLSLDDCFS